MVRNIHHKMPLNENGDSTNIYQILTTLDRNNEKENWDIHLLQQVLYFALKTSEPKRWWIQVEVILEQDVFPQEGLGHVTGSRKLS